MCGITGIIALTASAQKHLTNITAATQTLQHRGPDGGATYCSDRVALGHRRLSIIDTSEASNQPFTDPTGRYVMVFNGEIFNFKQLKTQIEQAAPQRFAFHTSGDTEVLLNAYILWGKDMLPLLNGFFAFIIYDTQQKNLFVARDRYGVKPLLVYQDTEKLIFASEMKAILAFNIPTHLNQQALQLYLQLNYLPAPHCMIMGVRKLLPAHYLHIDQHGTTNEAPYYHLPYPTLSPFEGSYQAAQQQLHTLMDSAVQLRLIADVPVACFLSGGIDSSVITALAARHTTHLNTFSVGFKDSPLYDETPYALAVAKQYNTKHTVFQLSQTDLYQHLDEMLNTLDEPFADSSALAVYLLSKHTAKQVKVALSGDGGDELFAGYNKHAAEYQMYYGGIKANLVKWLHPLWQTLPQRRDTKLGNLVRQLARFSAAAQLTPAQRYQQWASFGSVAYTQAIVKQSTPLHLLDTYTAHIGSNQPITDVLKADIQLVLEGDMLRKVDLMSMANSLEVRTPFLDYRVVEFAFSLPDSYKIANTSSFGGLSKESLLPFRGLCKESLLPFRGLWGSKTGGLMKKRIVQDAFRHLLPPQIYNRPKHGFEVPITHWLQTDLKPLLLNDLLQKDFIEAQNIFYYPAIEQLLNRLFSNNPADAPMQVWALVVFQWWWKRHC